MSYKIYYIAFFCLAVLTITFPASAQYEIKDSFYFMKDDGVFSDEDKDEEAEYIEQQCSRSVMEQQYYNCSCIAGAFRLKRDEEKLMPQDVILYDLYNDKNSKCVDSAKVAGGAYNFCTNYTKYFRTEETAEDNETYCKCVGNKVAIDFSKEPRLKSRFVNELKVKAMGTCDTRYYNSSN